jgi:hypothetical protein
MQHRIDSSTLTVPDVLGVFSPVELIDLFLDLKNIVARFSLVVDISRRLEVES